MNEITYKIQPARYLYGVRIWAQWYFSRVPRFELFYYLGKDVEKDLYFFKSRTEKTQIMKTLDQIGNGGFRPFLLDTKRIERYY
jgi:hypothetical protein